MTYIRIGLGLLELGQYTAVLELWPKGYKSPKHHHGGCAGSVRVLYGALNCQLFDSILDDEPIKFKGDDGQLDLPNEDQAVLKLTTGNTTWLNRQNWWVHQVQCHDDFDFALSVHLYKSCSDAFAFMKPTTGHTEAPALTQVEGARALEKGMPNNDYFWNISLPASDERVKEIGCPADSGQSAGPLDFEKHVLNEAKDKPTTPIPPSHPGPAGDQSRMPSRQNIKDATKQPPERVAPSGLSLQAKLDARREKEYGGPLQPPGLTTVHADASAREGAPDAGVTTEPSFIEDDDDELHNGVSAHWAALNGHKEVLHDMAPETLSSKNDDGEVPAHLAARNGRKEALQLLHDLAPETLSSKSNDGRVPAHLAARNGHKEVLQLLHDLAPETLSSKNNRGVVPAHLAAHNGHKEALQLLHDLAPGTLSSKDNDGEVPAHCAASNGHKEALQLLHDLAFGTLSSKNNDGEVPAHWAALNGHKEALQLLHDLAPGTLFFKNDDGEGPAHWAAFRGHKGVLQLLHDLAPGSLSSTDWREELCFLCRTL
ncbi:ANKRD44 [Symbiodinium necroappetens]|uniref:ANKRD44 protein n=1 Tax=Symbiodinium necroappetens TaxID=1628268 RepID=A0A812WB07_9DINO|nr:ANKRD44 [Symbiodinium necroappetens]